MIQKQILTLVLAVLISLSFVSGLSIKNVESFPQEIMPGETAEISIEIENTLGEDITNLNVKLDLSEVTAFAPYQSGSERFLDELGDEDEEVFDFDIITLPTASSGIYKIPVIITYLDENETFQTKNEEISLIVNSPPELNIFSEDSILIRGQDGTISLKIVNSGLSEIKFSYLTAKNVAGVQFFSEKEQYVGDIDSDDFDSVEYEVHVSDSASNLIKISVTLRYKDATNKEFEETKEIDLRVYSLKEAQERGFVPRPNRNIFFGIAAVIIGYILYRFWKKRKLKKKK